MRLVYLSPVPWASFAQRPHRLVEWFHARQGEEVLWVDPYPTRFPGIFDLFRKNPRVVTVTPLSVEVPPWLRMVQPRALPIEPLPGSGLLNRYLWNDVLAEVDQFIASRRCMVGIGKPSTMALQILSRNRGVQSFYDAMDDFPAFYEGLSRKAMVRRERAVATQVTKILVSSSALAKRLNGYNRNVFVALNACMVETIPMARFNPERKEPPILGYVGTIGHWFDWPLVIALANSAPMMRIRLIGPMYCQLPGKLPENIEILPACKHAAAIRAMQDFSVGLIPFKRIDLTASVDPIKYYEYRALGLPVLSTYFGEMTLREKQSGVYLVNDQSDFLRVLEQALAYEPDKNEILKFRNEHTWGAHFDASGILS